jgi:hypothetical protein
LAKDKILKMMEYHQKLKNSMDNQENINKNRGNIGIIREGPDGIKEHTRI